MIPLHWVQLRNQCEGCDKPFEGFRRRDTAIEGTSDEAWTRVQDIWIDPPSGFIQCVVVIDLDREIAEILRHARVT